MLLKCDFKFPTLFQHEVFSDWKIQYNILVTVWRDSILKFKYINSQLNWDYMTLTNFHIYIYNSTTHMLLATWSTFSQVNHQIGTAVQNPFSNVKCFTFILVLKSFSFLNKRTNLASRLQQGALLLFEDGSHFILALTK